MSSTRTNFTVLMIGAAILMMGQGLLVTLLPVRGALEGLSTTWIGYMGSAYYGGFAIGCLIGPGMIRNVGHIRVFAGFAALTAAATLLFELLPSQWAWVATRGFTGVCFAILSMAIESWLNELSNNKNRGRILSVYIIVGNIMIASGQLMLNLRDPASSTLFILGALMICISLAPISLSTITEPSAPPSAKLRIGALYKLSPVGFVGCLAFGLVDGSFWSLGPVFAQERGFSVAGITIFMSAFMLGGTLLQWPIGWISDHIDRRIMIAFCCFGTIGTGLALAFMPGHENMNAYVVACLHGGFMFPLYGLILSHANDYAPKEKMVEISGGLLLVYGMGAVLGPTIVSPLMDQLDAGYLFLSMTVLFGVLAVFSLYRIIVRPGGEFVDRTAFVPAPKSSQAFYELEAEDEEPLS
ncbi:MAG: MFS transporter [Rhodospirillales bacterium]|nr:MFS transporter [Rhodospirillales bacterium]MBT5520154.1 MFS transporter [Rhodospirillales bacterium]MBT6109228.1 MFS transporter [Rhodospirillales bacterium]MBT6827161.1 MFS transporter [Rhodospirillales bacterium]MBT7779309.1 MFS transporter [Rhodospirillales bacterium]